MSDWVRLIYIGSICECVDNIERVLLAFLNLTAWLATVILLCITADFLFREDCREEMPLKEKKYQPDYVTVVSTGKVTTTQYYPESFDLYFDKISCSVSKSLFEDSNYGDLFLIDYYSGITGLNYCVNAERVNKYD